MSKTIQMTNMCACVVYKRNIYMSRNLPSIFYELRSALPKDNSFNCQIEQIRWRRGGGGGGG
jgi:hypothetical protein